MSCYLFFVYRFGGYLYYAEHLQSMFVDYFFLPVSIALKDLVQGTKLERNRGTKDAARSAGSKMVTRSGEQDAWQKGSDRSDPSGDYKLI